MTKFSNFVGCYVSRGSKTILFQRWWKWDQSQKCWCIWITWCSCQAKMIIL